MLCRFSGRMLCERKGHGNHTSNMAEAPLCHWDTYLTKAEDAPSYLTKVLAAAATADAPQYLIDLVSQAVFQAEPHSFSSLMLLRTYVTRQDARWARRRKRITDTKSRTDGADDRYWQRLYTMAQSCEAALTQVIEESKSIRTKFQQVEDKLLTISAGDGIQVLANGMQSCILGDAMWSNDLRALVTRHLRNRNFSFLVRVCKDARKFVQVACGADITGWRPGWRCVNGTCQMSAQRQICYFDRNCHK